MIATIRGLIVLEILYVDTIFAPAFRVRAGKGKPPFGFERLHSASNILFMERAFPTALVPNHDIGVQVLGDISGGVVSYRAGVMNGVADGGSADVDNNDGKDVSGRVVVRPFTNRADAALRGLVLASQACGGPRRGFLRCQSCGRKPCSSRISRTRLPGTIRSPRMAPGTAIRRSCGTSARRSAGAGGWGAFQIAARYHALQVDDRAFALGFAAAGASRKAEGYTVGLRWYATGNLWYTLNFERTVFDGDPGGPRPPENGLAFRTQVNF